VSGNSFGLFCRVCSLCTNTTYLESMIFSYSVPTWYGTEPNFYLEEKNENSN
jgi:hypothetical protein